jgi:LacI family transcriptional regulator
MTRRVTMADVAERAGVSKTAVSLVLNDRPGTRLSKDVADRVRAAAAELDYRPNPAARALRKGTSQIVGFISDEVTITRYASAMIRGALDIAQQHEHTVLIAETGINRERRDRAVQTVLDQRPDGLIFGLMGARQIEVPTIPADLPVVILNGISAADHPSVLPAEFSAGSDVAEALVVAGHRRIGLIGSAGLDVVDPRVSATIGDRLAGIRAVLSQAGAAVVEVGAGLEWEPQLGHRATHEILDAHPQLSGLICLNDRLAFGAYQALQERGRHIPDDISVVSFDDDEIAAYLRPQLTTARIPYEEMGRQAMAMVLDRTEDRFCRRRVPMPVQHRGSVGPPQLSASM